MSALHAVTADKVFDGTTLHRQAAVVLNGGRIAQVLPQAELSGVPIVDRLPDGLWLAPGFVDLQVNGGGDALFNNSPTVETIATIAAAHRKFGTTGFLVTLITDVPEKTTAAMISVRAAMDTVPGLLGLHLEGPFLAPEKAGVHHSAYIRQPARTDVKQLTAPRRGALLVTLAPERVPAGFIADLVDADVCVSLGHSMATYEQTQRAISEGLTGFTHLFNAMRPMASREPGPIAAALEQPTCSFGLIVDGIHVAPPMLHLALRGNASPMLVTDAMPPVGGTGAAFKLYGEEVLVSGTRCVRADGTLAGALLDMATAVRNCVLLLGLPLEHALRFASVNPASFLGLRTGRLAAGYRADMIALDPEKVEVVRTWIAGSAT